MKLSALKWVPILLAVTGCSTAHLSHSKRGRFPGSEQYSAMSCEDGHNFAVYPDDIFDSATAAPGSSASELLSQDLRKYVVGFCHPFYLYSYMTLSQFDMKPDEKVDIHAPTFQNMYADVAPAYMSITKPKVYGENMWGLYFAVDPIVSREFGKENWIMYRAEAPQTLKALNIATLMYEKPEVRYIPKAIQEKMKQEGCDEFKYDYLFRKNKSAECRKIAIETLKLLDVDAIQYSWTAADFQSCRHRQRFAYIVFRPERLMSTEIFSYLGVEKSQATEAKALKALYRTARKNESPFELDWSTKDDHTVSKIVDDPKMGLWNPWDKFEGLSDAEITTWAHAHLLGCQD